MHMVGIMHGWKMLEHDVEFYLYQPLSQQDSEA